MEKKLNINTSNLTKSELRIWKFFNRNISRSIYMTISEIAEETDVSEATVTRFTRKIGYKSFSDFKMSLVQLYHSNAFTKNEKFPTTVHDFDSTPSTIEYEAQSLYENINDGLVQAVTNLNYNDVELVSNTILSKERTMIVGFSSSGIVAEEFFYRLVRIGLNCICVKDSHALAFQSAHLTEDDYVIFISHSGDIKEQITTAKLLRERNVPVTCITSNLLSPLSIESDISLIYSSKDETVNYHDIPPYITIIQIYIIDLLSIHVSKLEPISSDDHNSDTIKFLQNISF